MHCHNRIQEDYLARSKFLTDTSDTLQLSRLIDHTLLKSDAHENEFQNIFQQANQHQFRAICIPSCQIESASLTLEQSSSEGSRPLICTVIGFPLGNSSTLCKVEEITACRQQGAKEFDYVQNIGWVRDKNWKKLTTEAQALVNAAQGDVVKVILETSLLSEEEIFESALAAARGGVHILKTSTGFCKRGATVEDVVILRQVLEKIENENQTRMGIKASGGIKTFADALELLRAGATRLGTSSGVALVTGGKLPSATPLQPGY